MANTAYLKVYLAKRLSSLVTQIQILGEAFWVSFLVAIKEKGVNTPLLWLNGRADGVL